MLLLLCRLVVRLGPGMRIVCCLSLRYRSRQNHIARLSTLPGSSASFCTEHLMRKLNLTGTRGSILLQISSLDGQTFVDLPELYTQSSMPVNKNNILVKDDLMGYPYLERFQIPRINVEFELLISIFIFYFFGGHFSILFRTVVVRQEASGKERGVGSGKFHKVGADTGGTTAPHVSALPTRPPASTADQY